MVPYELLIDVFKAWVLLDLLFIVYIIFINIPQNVSYRTPSCGQTFQTNSANTDPADFRTRLRIENRDGSVRHPRSIEHHKILQKIWQDVYKVDTAKVVKDAFNKAAQLSLAILQDWFKKYTPVISFS